MPHATGDGMREAAGDSSAFELLRSKSKSISTLCTFRPLFPRPASTEKLFHGNFHNGLQCWDDGSPVHAISFLSAPYSLQLKLMDQQAPGYNLREFRPGFTSVCGGPGTSFNSNASGLRGGQPREET